MKKILTTLLMLIVLCATAHAETFKLTNGDKVTGTIVRETEKLVVVQTMAMGEVVIEKIYIKPPEPPQPNPPAEKSLWERQLSLGYSLSRGNTEDSSFSGEFNAERETDETKFTANLSSYISSANKKEDARKFSGLIRMDDKFGDNKEWFRFVQFQGTQDRFANINYRLTPSAGVGYWFHHEDDFKLNAEAAFGFEHTNYRDDTDSENEAVFVPSAYLEKQLTETTRLTQKVTLFPSLANIDELRFKSETKLSNKISENTDLSLKLVDEYDSNPQGDTKKNDLRLISSLDYKF